MMNQNIDMPTRCRERFRHAGILPAALLAVALICIPAASGWADENYENTYSRDEVGVAMEEFFQGTTEGIAEILEKIFKEQGRPVGYIRGNEGGGAFIVGLRYGEGFLIMKNAEIRKVYWQGPSAGFDFGGNASKVFTLIYGMKNPNDLYQRFPGVDGSAYFVGGLSMNYQHLYGITLAPIRTGVGLRLGANVGYLHYTRKPHINPF